MKKKTKNSAIKIQWRNGVPEISLDDYEKMMYRGVIRLKDGQRTLG